MPLAVALWVVSTLPESAVNAALMTALRAHGFTGKLALALRSDADSRMFSERGVDRVFRPYDDAADFAASEIGQALAHHKRGTAPSTACLHCLH